MPRKERFTLHDQASGENVSQWKSKTLIRLDPERLDVWDNIDIRAEWEDGMGSEVYLAIKPVEGSAQATISYKNIHKVGRALIALGDEFVPEWRDYAGPD